MKCCSKCQEWKPEDCFMFRYDRGQKRSRERACRDCRKNRDLRWRQTRTTELRQQERQRARLKAGKRYRPRPSTMWWAHLGTGYGKAVNLKAHGWRTRVRTQQDRWIERLRVELPHLYDSALAYATLEYRARYNLDSEFKAAQIRRAHKRRSEEEHGLFFEDGTLTGPVICRLFAAAKRCVYCDQPLRSEGKTLDHVWPRSKGGWHSVTNAVVCCYSCNSRKHGMSPARWLARVQPSRRSAVLKAWHSIGVTVDQPQLVA